jgi:hypothetical protein
MMAYNPNIVVGAWGGNTAPDGGGGTISAFGTEVGQQILAPFINGLPTNMRDWYRQPAGIVTGSGCRADRPSGGREIFLAGTEQGVNCAAAATPTPSATPTPTAAPVPAATAAAPAPSIIPTDTPAPKPSGTPTPKPKPSAPAGAATTQSPTPSG